MSTIYIHWPFCASKCKYCDFYSVPLPNGLDHKMWLERFTSVLTELGSRYYHGEEITSIYFGGGTPSLLPVWFVSEIVIAAASLFNLSPNTEITIEANPNTLSPKRTTELKSCGVNRISIGVQSLIDSDLKTLGRSHDSAKAIECVYDASSLLGNVSIDMIYNRPGQSLKCWESELEAALRIPITHISLYELIIEDGTEIKRLIDTGALPQPSDSSEFLERTIEIAEAHNFEMYEVSNFATSAEYRCQHNLSYWLYQDYYGVGPGAHSRVSQDGHKIALSQICDISKWLQWSEKPIFQETVLSRDDEFKEVMIMGLRSKVGVDLAAIDPDTEAKHGLKNKLAKLLENDYIDLCMGHVILTRSGLLKLNLIIRYLTDW